MGTPFMGEIKIVSFGFAPKGWSQCNGQFLPINQNQALFSLLGTTYGGNGQTTFALPDLRGRVPLHIGGGLLQGEKAGSETNTLTVQQMPLHIHIMTASTLAGDAPVLTNSLLGAFNNGYRAADNLAPIASATIANVGGSQAHPNMQPFLTLMMCIALQGVFPSRN